MKKLLLGMTVLALATAAVKAQFNPCVAYSVTNCYPPPSVALAPVSPITVSVCATVSASTTLITNTGRLRVTTVDESCSQTSTTIATNYPTVVSNWTVVYWNSQWTTNAGLSASFAPTNTGSGTITFYAKYTTPDPCPGLYTTNRIVSVTVTNCAPLILTQPADQTVIAGDSATFNVSACGAGLGYQWRFNGVSLPGATASSFTTNNVQAGSAGTYTVVITNSVGSATSTNAVLTVLVPPTIITQPISQTLAQGSNATFNVVADGSAPLSYQWRFNGANLPGATASSFTTNNVQAGSAGTYTVVITNSAGSVTSTNAVLTVLVPPTITTQPASQTVAQGSNATFNVVADGSAPLSYQWRFNGASLPGATASSFTTNNVQAGSAGTYTVVITNSAGSVTSTKAVLTVLVPPTITTQPASQTVAQGATVTFNVVADGSAPLSYQWRFNGSSLPGATGSLLALNNVQVSDIGNYSAVVTNLAGSLTSSVAALNLTCAAPPSGLVAWWPAEGNASDIIGGHDGALRGNATANATGQVGQAFSFDGTNDFVQIPDSFAFHPTNFTIEAWVRFAAMDSAGLGGSPAQDQYIVFKQNTRTNSFEGFDLSKTSDKFRFLVSSKLGSSVVVNSTNHISTNVWYHVAGVRGSNYLQLYINGQLHSQATVNFAQDYGPWSLFFGSSGRSYWDHKLKGNLDDVGFFNRALAAPEIQAIYSAAAAGKCSPPPSVTLLAPADGARFWAPDRITLAATAYSADRGVTNVEFFADGTRIGQSATPTNSVYTCAWTNPAVGAFALIAVAHDGSLAVTSSVAHVLVDSSASFVKGINLNGPSVVIEGNSWLSYTQALANGLSVSTNAMPGVNTNISPLVPSTTTDVDTMLQTFLRRFRFPPSQQQATNPPHFRPTRDDSFASSSYFTVTLSNVPPGLMVSNAITYRGWCSDHEHGIQPDEPCILYSVGDPFLDSDPRYRGKNLNKLNYLINHKSCTNYMEVQNAIWSLLGQGLDQNYLTPNFTAMTNDAHLHGGNFIPAPDDIALVLCNDSTNDQPVVIEIGGQGCTNNPVSFTLSQSGLTNGYYYVALYLVENLTNYARSLDFLVQDAKVATQVGTELQSCNWAKYGAFGANVTNGILKVEVSSPAKGDPMLMGLAIYSADANQPPTIITQPTNQNVGLGSNATFTVTATGTPPLHYQWRFNGTNLAAATLASLTLPSIESTQAGTYTVLVTNAFGSVLSSNAVLTISSLAPTVQITLPTNGQCFRPPTNILLQARALSPNSPVSEVRFFKESGLLGISLLGSNDIYSLTWTNARPGSYLLTASVSNQIGLSATSAPISVCILSNIPPLVNAGPDQPIVLPQSAALLLAGAASDPDGPADLAISWSKITGQGTVRFESAGPGNPAAINAWFSSAGDYLLRLFASDSEDSSSDDVLVTVTATNAAPAVSAGPDQTLTFPDYVYLPGQATDDGLPVGSTLTTTWSNCTPSVGTVTFDDPYSANTMARFASPGTYLLGLTASDGEKTSSTNVTVNIAAFSGTEYLQNVDVISAGVAGLRETNQGVIHLQGLSGKVKKAYLYWHGPTDSADPNVNQSVWLNRRLVTGRNIGFSFDNNWDFASGEQYANSQAYRADVTLLVAAFGSGDYLLRDLTKAAEVTANGASLIVFFDNPASTNKQDIILQQGNDSNGGFSFGVGGNNVSAIALGPDGGFIIGGYFASVGPVYESRNCIGKLHQNATLDYSFDPGTGVNPGMPGQVKAVALQPDGAVIIAGEFVSVDGASLTNIARFSSDGGLDAAFNMGAGADSSVNTLVLQPDGKIVLGGNFAHCNDIARSRIARLNADGSLDTGFNPGAGADGSINALALDGSGKILIGGDFTHYNGANRSRIARLNANGTLDSSFDPGAGADGSIEALALDPQGKILIGGDFGNYNGDSRPHMARLNPDGTLDAAFDPADAPNAPVLALSIQDGTNILAGGSFTMLGTNAFGRLARIKADGAIDTSFASAPGADGAVLVIVQENTGNLLIGGQFSNFDGAEHGLIARLDRDGHPLRTPLDPGWRLEFANIHYTNGPASIELHVGDGQYWSPDGSDYGASFWDQDMFINGSTWWQPEPMPTCYLTDDSQIFAGYSVPSAAGACGSRLWDIREKNLTGFLTNSPAPQALTIETAPPGLKGDYLALIVAMAKLPAGSVTNICHGQSVPTNLPPIARPDSFAVQRGAGGQLLDVLNNDSSPSQTLLAISAVGSASHGATAVIYDRSAVLYTPNQGYSGADSFSYTVTDAYGNSATATVALDVAGTDHAVLLCGQPQSGMLGVSGGVTTVRGSSQPADFYRFEAASGATVSIGLTTVDFKSHIYLRDPFGKLVASGSHSIYSYRNGNGQLVETDSLGSSIDNYPVLSSGIYTIEVTAHSRHAAGIYTLEFHTDTACQPQSRLQVWADGVNVPNGGVVDFGTSLTRTITILNAGTADAGEAAVWAYDPFAATPGTLPAPFAPGVARTVILTLDTNTPPGPTNQWIQIQNLSVNLTAFVPLPGPRPTATLTSPAGGTISYVPTNVVLSATASATTNTASIAKVEFFATTPFGRMSLGAATTPPYTCTWQNPPAGSYALSAWATDSDGRVGSSASVPITLTHRPPNQPPVAVNDTNNVFINVPNILPVLENDSDPNGDPLTIISVSAQNGTATISGDSRTIRYTPLANSYGDDILQYTISDGRNATATAKVYVSIIQTTVAVISPADNTLISTNVPITITASASTSDGAIARVEFYANNQKIAEHWSTPYQTTWSATNTGVYFLKAVALDTKGFITASEPVRLRVGDPTDMPVAQISNLKDGQIIRPGAFDLFGTASNLNANVPTTYHLRLYRPDDGQGQRLVADLTPAGRSGPKLDQLLERLDFSTVQNGAYLLELEVASEINSVSQQVRFILENNLKIGQFTFTEQDLTLPVSGIPLAVTRTYNSINPALGDFGFGWTYAMNDLDVEIDEERALVDELDSPENEQFNIRVGGGRDVTLTLPDGRRTTFYFYYEPGACNQGDEASFCYYAKWKAPYGVNAKLTSLDHDALVCFWGGLQWWSLNFEAGVENFDFRGFQLETADGTRYTIQREDLGLHSYEIESLPRAVNSYGKCKLTTIRTRAGDRITITSTNIQHFDSAERLTRSLILERTNNNLIAAIRDPRTLTGRPALKYQYDALTNLSAVYRLVNASAASDDQAYAKTTYNYTNTAFPHYLTSIQDARGVTVARSLYDETGKLIQAIDAAGNVTRFDHDLDGRKETVTDPLGQTTIHQYDERGNVTATVNALGQTTSRVYSGNNDLLSETDPLGHTIAYTYDDRGLRLTTTDPLGHTVSCTYDDHAQVTTITDARGHTTTNLYDPNTGNLTATIQALNSRLIVTSNQYDSVTSQLTATIDPLGNRTELTNDATGNLLKTTSKNVGNNVLSETIYAEEGGLSGGYDDNGNRLVERVTRTTPGGSQTALTRYEYDGQNRLLKTILPLHASGSDYTTQTAYDVAGKPDTTADMYGRVTRYFYDVRGNLTQTLYPDGSISRTWYDALGHAAVTTDRTNAASPTDTITVNGSRTLCDPVGRTVRAERLKDITLDLVE